MYSVDLTVFDLLHVSIYTSYTIDNLISSVFGYCEFSLLLLYHKFEFFLFSTKKFLTRMMVTSTFPANERRGVSIRSEDVRARRLEDVFRIVTLEALVPVGNTKSIFTQ